MVSAPERVPERAPTCPSPPRSAQSSRPVPSRRFARSWRPPCDQRADGCETDPRGDSGARGRRVAHPVSRHRVRQDGRPRAWALRLLALVGTGPRAAREKSPRSRARLASPRLATSCCRADKLAGPVARRSRPRECRSRRSFARRVDRGRVGGGATAARTAACARCPCRDSLRKYRAQSRRPVARDVERCAWPVTDDRARRNARGAAQPHPGSVVRIASRLERRARHRPGPHVTHLGRARSPASRADRGRVAERPARFAARPPPLRPRADVGSSTGAGFLFARLLRGRTR